MDRPGTDGDRDREALADDEQHRDGTPLADDAAALDAQRQRVANRTNIHDAGSDANDTPDGLTESEEAIRHAAEDIPVGQDPAGPPESVPVFDRGALPPKV